VEGPLDNDLVDVDALRAAQFGLQRLVEHLKTVATTTFRIPTDIGHGWTWPAATVSKDELVGLGVQDSWRLGTKAHGRR
jgi:hypothetical protein